MALSERMCSTVESVMPKIATQLAHRNSSNPPIDFSTAENWLIRPELVEFIKTAVAKELDEHDLSYQKGFCGDPQLLATLANTFNRLFTPTRLVEPSHVAVGPGGAAILESLLLNTCDAGDGMLVPSPFWSGFHFQFDVGPKVKIIPVTFAEENVLNENCIQDLESALARAECKVKGVVLCNPHNPLGRCYTKKALEAISSFCETHDLHLISDEIYALSTYSSHDIPHTVPFVSMLSLDLSALKVDPTRVHVIWSVSKDLGCSGLRLGALVSQGSPAMVCGVAMAANTQVSGLTAVAVVSLLSEPSITDRFIHMNKERLACAYDTMASFLRARKSIYIPAYAGIFVWAKLSSKVNSWDQEAELANVLAEKQVAVSAGKSYAAVEPGWYRLSFAIKPEQLELGLERLAQGIDEFEV